MAQRRQPQQQQQPSQQHRRQQPGFTTAAMASVAATAMEKEGKGLFFFRIDSHFHLASAFWAAPVEEIS